MSPSRRSYRVYLRERAREFYEAGDADTQTRLDRIFDRLEDNPFPDGDRKFYYTRHLPAICTAYGDEDFHIVYQLTSHDEPGWERWRIEIITIEESLPLDFGNEG